MNGRKHRKTAYRGGLVALLLAMLVGLGGCAEIRTVIDRFKPTEPEPAEVVFYDSVDFYAFGNTVTVTCYGPQCSEACMAVREEFFRLDGLFAADERDSEVALLNRDGVAVLSADTAEIFNTAIRLYWSTEGAFDVTMHPLRVVWGFDTGNYRAADPLEAQQAVSLVGSNRVAFDVVSSKAMLDPGQSIDFSDIAFGYLCDKLEAILSPFGVKSAMVVSGSKVFAYGSKADGEAWRIGIQEASPEQAVQEEYLGIVSVTDRAVITADPYTDYFIDGENGQTIHHLLDPATGMPAESDLMSVTVIAPSGAMADGLSAALYVMGQERAVAYWQANRTLFDMILVTKAGVVYATEPVAGKLETARSVIVLPVPAGN